MFEAYKVSVRVSLINNVSGGLLAMSRHFQKVGQDAHALEQRLNRIKALGMAGAGISAAGFMGLGILGKMIKPAEQYAHQLNIMNMAGMKHREIAESVAAAWKTTGDVITTTATENLRTLLDLRNVFGDLGEAKMALPIVSRIQAVLAASTESKVSGNSKDLAYGVAKSLDMIGAVQNKEVFLQQAEMMSKVITATQGRVLPSDYQNVFKYARQAKFQLSDEFKYEILPSLMQEMKGGGGSGSGGPGAMLAAAYRFGVQGVMNQRSAEALVNLGLVPASSILKTTTAGTTLKGGVKGSELFASNPFAWTQQVLLPALHRKYGAMTPDQMQMKINQIFKGNQLAANLIGEFARKPVNFRRDQHLVRGTMSTAQAYQAAISSDPVTARAALHAQWENFKTALTMSVVPILIPALMKLTRLLQDFAKWARENQTLVKALVISFSALSAAMAIGGTALAAANAFRGLNVALSFLGVGGGSLGAVATGIRMIGFAARGFLAVLAAYQVGHWIGKKIDEKTGLSSWIADQFARDTSTNPGSQYVHDANGKLVQVNTLIHMDGRKVAESVSTHQAKAMARPQAGTSAIDLNMAPLQVGAPLLGR